MDMAAFELERNADRDYRGRVGVNCVFDVVDAAAALVGAVVRGIARGHV